MSLRTDLTSRLDPTYKLPLGAGGGRDNIVKDTAVAVVLEEPNHTVDWAAPFKLFLDETRIADGLYSREPGNLAENSVDNVIGGIVAAKFLGFDDVAFKIIDRIHNFNSTYAISDWRGRFSWWNPSTWKLKDDWYGRFIGFKPFAYSAAMHPGYPVTQWSLLLFLASVAFTVRTPHDSTSDKILLWLEWQLMPKQPGRRLVRIAFDYWKRTMTAMYPRGPAEMLGVYYGFDHPFALRAPKTW